MRHFYTDNAYSATVTTKCFFNSMSNGFCKYKHFEKIFVIKIKKLICFNFRDDKRMSFPQREDIKESKEFFIRKGIGWALRQYSYTNPEAVITFVDEVPLHSLSKREALRAINRKAKNQ